MGVSCKLGASLAVAAACCSLLQLVTTRCACAGYKYICFNFRTFGSDPNAPVNRWATAVAGARLKADNGCDVGKFPFLFDFF